MSEQGLRALLQRIELQLEKWANESRTGGWSTHQVEPMRKLADEIRMALSGVFRV
jgi:hypothetical protein